MNNIEKYWVIIVLVISSFAVSSALIAEYAFEILPCEMCLYQRYPYYFIIVISLIFIIFKKIPLIIFYWITTVTFLLNLFLALWHVAIEQKILPGFSKCTSVINTEESLTDIKNQILNKNILSCDEITWSFMNISAATYNSLLLILLLITNIVFLIKVYNVKEKKKF